MRILLTRPEADARTSAEKLAQHGHACISAPLFEIAATGTPRPAGIFTGLLATSAHAFDTLVITPDLTHLPLHVVGARTGEAASRCGFAQPVNVGSDGADLARRIGAGNERFLYLAGVERRPELEKLLRAAGHDVTPWELYETRAVDSLPATARAALSAGDIDAVLHFSTRSAALYRDLARKAGLEGQALAPLQIAISARAARELEGAARIAIAPTPDFDGIISALQPLS